MDDKRKKRSKGIGLCGSLVTLFIILKITNIISWSWLWVFSPIWITLIICVVVFGSILVVGRMKKGKR
jgi:Flp pilus assembly protein TadB